MPVFGQVVPAEQSQHSPVQKNKSLHYLIITRDLNLREWRHTHGDEGSVCSTITFVLKNCTRFTEVTLRTWVAHGGVGRVRSVGASSADEAEKIKYTIYECKYNNKNTLMTSQVTRHRTDPSGLVVTTLECSIDRQDMERSRWRHHYQDSRRWFRLGREWVDNFVVGSNFRVCTLRLLASARLYFRCNKIYKK